MLANLSPAISANAHNTRFHSDTVSSASQRLQKQFGLLLSACLVALCILYSQSAQANKFERGGLQSVKVGEADLYPALRIDYYQNDNAFLTPENQIESGEIVVKPSVDFVADRRLFKFEAGYSGAYQSADEEALNYNDHALYARTEAALSTKKRVSAALNIGLSHEELGQNLTRGNANRDTKLVNHGTTQFEGRYTYGAEAAKGNVSFGMRLRDFRYTSRSDITDGRDNRYLEPFAAFSYRVGGDTRATVELRFRNQDFSNGARNRYDYTALFGLNFAATGKSGGQIALGSSFSDYRSSGVSNTSEIVIEGALFWEPTTFSRFDLSVNRFLNSESGALVSFDTPSAVNDTVDLSWRHSWSDRVSHTATMGFSNVSTVCPNRDSQSVSGKFELDFKIRRWVGIGFLAASDSVVVDECMDPDNPDVDLDNDRTRLGVYLRAHL